MQLRTSIAIKFFDSMFRDKYNFDEYYDYNYPTLFFGIYRKNDIRDAIDHLSQKILWFAGTDSMNEKTLHYVKKYCINDKTTVIAESEWIKKDLDRHNIKYKEISMLNNKSNNWESAPLGKSLYWYKGGKSKYGKQVLRAVQKAIPDLDIIVINNNDLSHEEMVEIYKKCFACARILTHDGQSQSVLEMGLMGRKSMWNGNIPCSVSYKNTEDIIEKIKELRKGYDYKKVARETKEFCEDNEKRFMDLIRETCGEEEVNKMLNKCN